MTSLLRGARQLPEDALMFSSCVGVCFIYYSKTFGVRVSRSSLCLYPAKWFVTAGHSLAISHRSDSRPLHTPIRAAHCKRSLTAQQPQPGGRKLPQLMLLAAAARQHYERTLSLSSLAWIPKKGRGASVRSEEGTDNNGR